MVKHVVMYSGGVGSWGAARRVVEQHGTADVTLLFTDTLIEDADLYRFLDEGAAALGLTVTRIAEGRTPWQVFRDRNFLGNNRVAPCSEELKQRPARHWVEANCDPARTTLYVGIDWTEIHRLDGARRGWSPWQVEAPLCEPPYVSKTDLLADLTRLGIEPPRLYRLGFPHNNCGGGCVRAGQDHFKLLYTTLPLVYQQWEENEEGVRQHIGKDVSILRDRSGGVATPLTLRALRERWEREPVQLALDGGEWGGCGCFLDEVQP